MDNKGIIDGLRKGEKGCMKPGVGAADLWLKNWKNDIELVKEASWWKWNM